MKYYIYIFSALVFFCFACKPSGANKGDSDKQTAAQKTLLDYFSLNSDKGNFKTCGFNLEGQGQILPDEIIKGNRLYIVEIYPRMIKKYQLNSPWVKVRGLYAWEAGDQKVLLYVITLSDEDSAIYSQEARLLLVNSTGEIQKNIFFAGNHSDDGETNICRELVFEDQGIVLNLEASENIPTNFEIEKQQRISF